METNTRWNQQNHEALGLVYFQIPVEFNSEDLGWQLVEATNSAVAEDPWKDVPEGTNRISKNRWVSAIDKPRGTQIKSGPYVAIVVRVNIPYLKPSQLCAFHNYMNSLVRRLAAMKIENVHQIYTDVVFRARGLAVDLHFGVREFHREINGSDRLRKILDEG